MWKWFPNRKPWYSIQYFPILRCFSGNFGSANKLRRSNNWLKKADHILLEPGIILNDAIGNTGEEIHRNLAWTPAEICQSRQTSSNIYKLGTSGKYNFFLRQSSKVLLRKSRTYRNKNKQSRYYLPYAFRIIFLLENLFSPLFSGSQKTLWKYVILDKLPYHWWFFTQKDYSSPLAFWLCFHQKKFF